jgi:hypothetical protein
MDTTGVKVLLCGIAKLENPYLREWVEHYKKIGFTNIVLYDNNDVDGEVFGDVIGDYIENGFVIVENARGKICFQYPAYMECYKKYKDSYDWMAFFDIDEFLELRKHNNIQDFLMQERFDSFDMIHVNWKTYTDSGKIHYSDEPVQERFTKTMAYKKCVKYNFPENNHVKSIVRCNKHDELQFIPNPHSPINVETCCNGVGEPVDAELPFCEYNFEDVFLKHYTTKSLEEWITRKMVRRYPDSHPSININHPHLSLNFYFQINELTKDKEKFIKNFNKQ